MKGGTSYALSGVVTVQFVYLKRVESCSESRCMANSGIRADPWTNLKRNVMFYARLGAATGALQANTEAKIKDEVVVVGEHPSNRTLRLKNMQRRRVGKTKN